MAKIIGNTTATPNPRPDWNQTDSTKADYIKNKPELGELAAKDEVAKTDLASDVQASLSKADSALQSYTESDPTVPSHVKGITTTDISNWNAKSTFSGNYNDLTNKPTIPTTTSQLTNNSDFATNTSVDTKIADLVNSAPEALDTLGELAIALKEHEDAYDALLETVGKKVDKETGKGLSTNDYTTAEKEKLAGLNNYTLPEAGSELGGVKTGGDVTIDAGIVTVNDDSHNHIISNVDGLQDELDNKALTGKSEIDTTTTYTKEVPSGSASYAKIDRIGGMTRKCTNLIDIPDATCSGAIAYNAILLGNFALAAGTYTLSVKYSHTGSLNGNISIRRYTNEHLKNITIPANTSGEVNGTFTLDDSTEGITVFLYSNITPTAGETSVSISKVMLNEGTTALPYEPFFEGLRSAPTEAVESVGVNLWKPFTTQSLNGVALTVDENGVCTLNGTCAASANFTVDGGTLDAGTYWLSDNAQGTFSNDNYARVQVHFVATGLSLQTENNHASNKTVVMTLKEPTSYSRRIRIESGHTYTNCKLYPMLNRGTTAQPYRPYTRNTLPIPEAVRPAHGINNEVYDYLDFGEQESVKRVGEAVFDGTEWWRHVTDDPNPCFTTVLQTTLNGTPALCSHFKHNNFPYVLPTGTTGVFGWDSSYINLYFASGHTSVEEWKAYLAEQYANGTPVTVLYELATPEVTDISDILPADNYIGVEGGGTLTFVNEYNYNVPTEVTFYNGNNDVISADTFVGDLAGTAMKAICDKNGNDIAETYVTAADLENLGAGDMLKSVYDTNGDGIVDKARQDSDGNIITSTYLKKSVDQLGNMKDKTIPELQSALDTWYKANYQVPNARVTFTADLLTLVTLWNNGNTTDTISAGANITAEIDSYYGGNNYVLIKLSQYSSKQVYYVTQENGEWKKIYKVAFTDDNITKVNGITPEWSGSVANGDTNWIAAWTSDGTKIKALDKRTLSVGSAATATNADKLGDVAAADYVKTSRKVNGKALSSDITLSASDVGALPSNTTIPTVNNGTLTIQKNGSTVATFGANQSTNATANITVPTKTSDITNDSGFITSSAIPSALKNPTALTFGSKTYDGSVAKEITAADLGLSGAMKFLGTSSTAISDGSTTKTITVNGSSVTVTAGNVVLYDGKEFVWDGSKWEELGHEGSFKVKQTAVASPSASGSTTAFIDTISQDANGNITATKKNVTDATTSAKGIVQLTNSTSSTSTTTAATPSSVKSAYDLASTAKTNAATAQATADGKVSKSGDTMSGNLTFATTKGIKYAAVDNDTQLWQVYDSSGAYGYALQYNGSGSGNNNDLVLISDNQNGTKINAVTMKQDGTTTFAKAITASGGITGNLTGNASTATTLKNITTTYNASTDTITFS